MLLSLIRLSEYMLDVLFFRARANSEELIQILQKNKMSFFHEPLMYVQRMKIDENFLFNKMNIADFIIITSQNVLQGLSKINKPVLLVGQKLYKKVLNKFQCEVICIGNNVQEIKNFIIANQLINKNFLYLRGNEITMDFNNFLPNLSEIILYRMQIINKFSTQLINILQYKKSRNILFFSVNSVVNFINLSYNYNIDITSCNFCTLSSEIALYLHNEKCLKISVYNSLEKIINSIQLA